PNGNITRLDKLSENIADILQADNKVLVAQHHGTENMLNINTKYIHRTIVNNVLSKSKNLAVFAVVSSDHKSIFIACDHYLLKIFADGHYQIRTMESLILWISKDKDNMIWVCPFNDGAIALNENDILGPPVHNYLSDKSVSSVLQDKEGGFWFSTLDDGVFYLSSHKSFSYVYPSNLPDYEILHVETGDKEIFAGTGNCYLSVIKNNKITNYPVDTTTHSEITSLTYDRTHKELLIGTTYDPYVFKDGKISKLIDNYKKLNKKYEGILISARSIIKESKDTYWFGNIAGLSLVDINRHVVLSNSFRDHTVNNIRISSLYRFPDGSLLIGSTEGLWKYKQGQFIKINSSIPGLNKRILKIAGDSLGRNIWIATKGDGLYLKTIDGIHHFTRKEGLLNNSPTDLCLNRNDLWLTTSQGISCITIKKYKPLSYSLHNFNVDYGLASNQVYQIKTFGNKILVATNRGLSIIDTRSHKTSGNNIPVYLTKIKLMMKDTLLPANCSLPYNFNSISFSFVGISYQSISKIRYQYRLLGLDDEWHNTQNTEISFPFLPPHAYEFQLRTIDDNGKVTSNPVIQKFTINKPFWKTFWFIALVISSILSAVYIIYRNRLKTIQHNNQVQQEINQYRQQALSKQMNPHFIFNSLNSIQYYIVKNDRNSSTTFLSKFATLMRVILNNSQTQAITLHDEMNALKLYLELEKMRFKDKFKFTFDIDPRINQISTFVPPFIIQPFIENSIWHGLMNLEGNGLLQIKLIQEDSILRCIVEDNGIGRQRAAEIQSTNLFKKTSKGISITETRLRLLDEKNSRLKPITYTDLYDQNGNPEGTRVEILIPILN
ncbi:MAG: histidine kinase, partial [Bacteroidota bacterium]|nr:histidine kinase [Bacteroidota bacterium]